MNTENPFQRQQSDSPSMGITLAPLVDVVFLLLIFFMVSTTFQVQPGLEVNLPHSSTTTEVQSEPWIITIKSNGNLYLDNEQVSLADLKEQIVDTQQRGVILKADRQVPHGAVVSVLDQVKQAGISVVDISTRPVDESS